MNSVVVGCVSGIPETEVVMPNHVNGKKVILYREPCCEKGIEVTVNNHLDIMPEYFKRYGCIMSYHTANELGIDDELDTICWIDKEEDNKMKITRNELLKKTKTGELQFDLMKLADDMGLELNEYQGNICVEGGVDIIVEGEELSTTFYSITTNTDQEILMLQNNVFGNAPYEPFRFDVDTAAGNTEEIEKEITSKITTVRIELGIDIENADKVSIRYDGRMFSLNDYVKETVDIKFDTSLFKPGDIVKITARMHKRFKDIKLEDQVGMLEHFNEGLIAFQTVDIDSGRLEHYKFYTIDFCICDNVEEFSIEKVDIQ